MSSGQSVPEAKLEQWEAGLVPAGEGWFVVNAREARWIERPGRGHGLPLTGWTEEEAETYFPQLGLNLVVLGPGEPIGMYHWEADQEGFLVLSGEALLIIEGAERSLRQWDFVHCPPGTKHVIVGAGEVGCVVVCVGSREHIGEHCNGGDYVVDETALRHGARRPPRRPTTPTPTCRSHGRRSIRTGGCRSGCRDPSGHRPRRSTAEFHARRTSQRVA
jgi:mannose-6-phosphate isomerase-like protein (cupin superfamily)